MLESRGTRWLMQEIMIFSCDDHYFTDVGENFAFPLAVKLMGKAQSEAIRKAMIMENS